MKVCDIKDDMRCEGFLLVRESSIRKTKADNAYLDLLLSDRNGASIGARIWSWDVSKTPPTLGAVIFISGCGSAYKEKIQLKIDTWRFSALGDDVNVMDFIPSAPGDPQAMLDQVRETVAGMHDDSIRNIVTELLNDACRGGALLTAPAAMQLHHAERGGLLHHTTGMLNMAQALCGVYDFLDADLLFAGVIIHDLGKLTELERGETGLVTGYSLDGKLIGHLVRGAIDIERIAEKVDALPEQARLLQHLVLSHHGKLEFGSPILPKIPEAEALSILDLLDARLFQMHAALDNVEDGGYSEKVWALDNRELYKVPSAVSTLRSAPEY